MLQYAAVGMSTSYILKYIYF